MRSMSNESNAFDMGKVQSLIQQFEASVCTHLEYSVGDTRIVLQKEGQHHRVKSHIIPQETELVVASIVGTFRASVPQEDAPFVQKGQWVKKGQVIGGIEAMKVLSEVTSPVDGTIEEIYVADNEPVAYNQPLVSLRIHAESSHSE